MLPQLSENKHLSNHTESNTVMFMKDLAGRYLYVNNNFEKLFSLSSKEVKGKTDYEIFSVDIADAVVRNDQIVTASGQSLELEEIVPQGDVLHTYHSVKIPIPDMTGEIYAVCGIAIDITEHKKAEAELQITDTIFDSKVGIMVTDSNNVILRVNKAFTEMSGYSKEEVLGHTPKLLQSGRHDEKFYSHLWETINLTGK